MPIFLAGRRPATAALAQTHARDLNLRTDLHCARRILAIAQRSSCLATPSANALMGASRRHAALPRANPHSARGATACQFPRFRSLKAFGRRPRCKPHRRHGPASETLNIRYRFGVRRKSPDDRNAPKADAESEHWHLSRWAKNGLMRCNKNVGVAPPAREADVASYPSCQRECRNPDHCKGQRGCYRRAFRLQSARAVRSPILGMPETGDRLLAMGPINFCPSRRSYCSGVPPGPGNAGIGVPSVMYGRRPRCKRNLTISEAFGCGHVFGL